MFSQMCVCSGEGGGGGLPHLHLIILPLVPCPFWGVPHLHPIILPLVPCPFWGATPVTGPRSLSRGYSTPRLGGGGVPQDGVPPWPGQDGVPYPLARSGSGTPPSPSQVRMGYLPSQVRMGYHPIQAGQDGVPSPWPGLGYPPPPPRRVMPRAVRLLRFPTGGLSCYILSPLLQQFVVTWVYA